MMLGDISRKLKLIVRKNEVDKEKQPLKLVGKQLKVKYDGETHEIGGFINEVFHANNKRYKVTYNSYLVRGKDVSIYTLEEPKNLRIINSRGKDVTDEFDIEIVPGELVIDKREIILRSASGSREYDGSNFELHDIEILGDGCIEGEEINCSCKGSILVPGKCTNSIVYSFSSTVNPKNYNIKLQEGTLEILDRIIPYELRLSYPDVDYVYSGKEISIQQPNETCIKVNGINYQVKNLDVSVTGKNIGNYDYVVDGTPEIFDEFGNDVSKQFNIIYKFGKLKIKSLTNINKNKSLPSIENILISDTYNKMILKDLYSINESEYIDKSINEMDFSVRLFNCLHGKCNVNTVGEMLKLTYAKLVELKGLGKTSLKELDETLRNMSSKEISSEKPRKRLALRLETKRFLRENSSNICKKQFKFCEEWDFTDNELKVLEKIKSATEVLDSELIAKVFENPEQIISIMHSLNSAVSQYEEEYNVYQQIESAYKNISNEKLNCNIKWFIYAYTDDDNTRKFMLEWCENQNINYIRDLKDIKIKENDRFESIFRFVKWCGFDIKKDIDEMFNKLYKKNRDQEVICYRANGNTLDKTGKIYGVTRERIRQVEKRTIKRFGFLLSSYRIILKIFAERNGDEILTPVELSEYFGDRTEQALYLLRKADSSFYTYDNDLGVVVEGSGLAERAQTYVDKLPEVFKEDKLSKIIEQGIEDYNLTEEVILAHINVQYKKTEKLYHRFRLTLQSIYDVTLKKHYPEGIWVYGKKDLAEFRSHIQSDYGDIVLPNNDRALAAQVCRASILCGRGIYKAKKSKYLSNTLLKKIEKYIDSSESSIFMTNTIFSIFEEELRAENVDNKYYLQGILHEEYGDKWYFRRDYVSKDSKITSIYTEIVAYIKRIGYPVTKRELQKKYPGITEIVLNIATDDPKIVNLFGCYIHVDNLKLSISDISYLKSVIELFLNKNDSCNCRMIFAYIMRDNPIILKRNYINFPFGLYSLLEYCFEGEYNFSRPYIAKIGVEITTTLEMLQEMVQESDVIEISEISNYAKKQYHQINNMLDFLNSCNETHFLINADEVASVDIIGITEKDVGEIEQILDKEVSKVMPINNLKYVHLFPKIEFPWTEWLIYSAIKRWGKKYEVQSSEAQLRHSVPLIAPMGKMYLDEMKNIQNEGELMVADDLNNIDDFISDFSLEELDLDEF